MIIGRIHLRCGVLNHCSYDQPWDFLPKYISQDFSDVALTGIEVLQELWASPMRSPQFSLRRVPQLFLFLLLFGLFAGFLLLTFFFILFSAFVSHRVSPFFVKVTIFL